MGYGLTCKVEGSQVQPDKHHSCVAGTTVGGSALCVYATKVSEPTDLDFSLLSLTKLHTWRQGTLIQWATSTATPSSYPLEYRPRQRRADRPR